MPQDLDPGSAQSDLSTDYHDHDTLCEPIWDALDTIVTQARSRSYAEVNFPQLLQSMRETHSSIRAVHTGAGIEERNKKRLTGRWADMLVLARAQTDAVFIGILLAHDPNKWGPLYYKSGWATEAQATLYEMRRFRNTSSGMQIYNTNVYALKKKARLLQVTIREWIATLAIVRGKPLRKGATPSDAIKPFPTPGRARELVAGGPYEDIALLLWVQWKSLCDPAHAGLRTVALRHMLRDTTAIQNAPTNRDNYIHNAVTLPSVSVSLVSILTLITVYCTLNRENVNLRARATKAWSVLSSGTIAGNTIWDKWAHKALGALHA